MSQRVGSTTGHELWLRCPECGDSQRNPNKGHLSVNLHKGVFHCVRCSYSGVLSPKQMLDLATRYDVGVLTDSPKLEMAEAVPVAGSTRFSALKRWHHIDKEGDTWDVFEVRNWRDNEVVGQYLRLGSSSLIFGESGLGWVGDGPLLSSESSPLRVVEGPYDVLSYNDVCCYGMLRSQALKQLIGHYVLLCPDGDVWQDEFLRARTMKTIRWCFDNSRAPWVVGLEMIPDGKDPDEVHPSDRLYVPRDELIKRVVQKRVMI